jgi:hypothetical protein
MFGSSETYCAPADEYRQCEQGADKSTTMRDQTHVQSNSSILRVAIDPISLTFAYLCKMYGDGTSSGLLHLSKKTRVLRRPVEIAAYNQQLVGNATHAFHRNRSLRAYALVFDFAT